MSNHVSLNNLRNNDSTLTEESGNYVIFPGSISNNSLNIYSMNSEKNSE